jgi:glyoxalase family protein
MAKRLNGIHHVTAMASDPEVNREFYSDVLGLRLVKKTVNYDDPGTYHLYYGNETGEPGTVLTFFPWPGARRGTPGVGQTTAVALSVPVGSLGFWHDRLRKEILPVEAPKPRFDDEVLTFLDPDGLRLELVAHHGADDRAPWLGAGVADKHAVRGVHSVTLRERRLAPTAELLTGRLGFRKPVAVGQRHRFPVGSGAPGAMVDVLVDAAGSRGQVAAGSVHHVAFRTETEIRQVNWRERLVADGHHVSPIMDRQYFHSIYFREPGGVLFEVATDGPGFTADEPLAELGSGLMLPEWLEPSRERIEAVLPPLSTAPVVAGKSAAKAATSRKATAEPVLVTAT